MSRKQAEIAQLSWFQARDVRLLPPGMSHRLTAGNGLASRRATTPEPPARTTEWRVPPRSLTGRGGTAPLICRKRPGSPGLAKADHLLSDR